MAKFIDITGKKFGKLTAIKLDHREKNSYSQTVQYWLFKCDCGKEVVLHKQRVMSGNTKSCGCIRHFKLIKKNKKHGLSKSRLYVIYSGMKARCYDKKHISYQYYGGRGINICNEWKNDFYSFYKWAIDNGYDDTKKRGELTIDRIDVNSDYSPENCRWVSIKEQNRNHRNNYKITFNGKTYCVSEWAERLGIKPQTIKRRIARGWNVREALTKRVE